ncbi:FISUMP domain-containing protein [Fibrobacter sp. UWB11]|uniref:FISUMP domain-containing protein n=1 Tax=Fibrobacter sp. UWB11 TaxID=1896202 RepID=UPI00092B2566|nr:FISUMP domain-containing protein [Fibrobacter sp. UWB11]SIO39062.1 major paralogous domain-containing protein [Fibrobacter sp. UWB11]
MFNSKVYTPFICKWIMLFALMLAACSSDDGTVRPLASQGGTEEETAYVLSGRIGDDVPKMLREKKADSISGEALIAQPGAIVVVFELDSVTLAKTGRSFTSPIKSEEGLFAFEEIALQSPYVLIENQRSFNSSTCLMCKNRVDWDSVFTDGSNVVYMEVVRAIVDLRKIKKISVNTLTSMKVPLWQKYVAEGMNVAAASDKAESEVLENFGVYENLGAFEEAADENSDLPFLEEIAGDSRPYSAFKIFLDLNKFYDKLLFNSPELISGRGSTVERLYMNTIKMGYYRVGYFAKEKGYGRCTESRENEVQYLDDYDGTPVSIVCRSGKWTIGFKKMDYTKGTMTDPRDGKIYNTVTYDVGGVSQTWMAENLNFSDTSLTADSALKVNLPGHSLCKAYDPECKLYGRYYSWIGAMNIGENDFRIYSVEANGDTLFLEQQCYDAKVKECPDEDYDCMNLQNQIKDHCDTLYTWSREIPGDYEAEKKCVDEKYLECDKNDYECLAKVKTTCDSLYGDKMLPSLDWSYGYVEYMSDKNKDDYQGVCPDGWRIPTADDWRKLLHIMGDAYGVEPLESGVVLYDDYATGFGMEKVVTDMYINEELGWISIDNSWWVRFLVADAAVYSIGFFRENEGLPLNKLGYSDGHEPTFFTPGDNYYSAFVRCIKK